MEPRESGIEQIPAKSFAVRPAPTHLRFRTEARPGGDPMRRCWEAIFSYGEGWARFDVVVNLSRATLTLHRSLDADYSAMLRQLLGKTNSLTPIPRSPRKVESMTFDIEILGYKMSRQGAGEFQPGRSGDWLVVQAFLPGSADSFLFSVNDRLNAGEIAIQNARSMPTVANTLMMVFG